MFGLNAKGLTAADSFRGTPESIQGDAVALEHFPGAAGNPVHVLTSADTADEVAAAVAAADGIATVAEPQVIGDDALIEAELADAADSQAAYDTVEELRATLDDVGDGEALVGGNTALNLDVQTASQRDNLVIIPLIMLVVLAVLAVLLRAIVAPADPHRDGGAVLRRGARAQRADLRLGRWGSSRPTARSRCSSSCSSSPSASTTTSS